MAHELGPGNDARSRYGAGRRAVEGSDVAVTQGESAVGVSVDDPPYLKRLREVIQETVVESVPFDDLVADVAREQHADVNDVVAAVWDLVQEHRLAYDADDARVAPVG